MDGEFSLARRDSASRRARWQQLIIQAPEYVHGWTVLGQCKEQLSRANKLGRPFTKHVLCFALRVSYKTAVQFCSWQN